MTMQIQCNECGEVLIVEATDTQNPNNDDTKKVIVFNVRPCSNCITKSANKMTHNFKHNLLHRLNLMADKTAEQIKGEVHSKLIHNITTTIGKTDM